MKTLRLLRWWALLLLACLCVTRKSANGADYLGSAVCAECHNAQYKKQVTSHHAHALRPIAGSSIATLLLDRGHSPDGKLSYELAPGGIAVHENGFSGEPILEWAFGAGAQGITPVGRLGGQYFEHRFSYYSRIQDWAPTFGHPRSVSTPFAEVGILNDNKTISSCFNCHATAVQRNGSDFDLTGMAPGVQCERCHGPGSSHVKAAKGGAPREAIVREVVNPGRFGAKALVQICGECHRLPSSDSGDEPELEDPVTVRFAPIGLMASRCFRGDKTTILSNLPRSSRKCQAEN